MPARDIFGCESLSSFSRAFPVRGNPLFASAASDRANPMARSVHRIVTVRAQSAKGRELTFLLAKTITQIQARC